MTLDNIIQFILNPILPDWLLIVKFIFLALNLFFIVTIVLVLLRTTWLKRLIFWDIKEYLTFRHYGLPRIDKKWVKIREKLDTGSEPEAKLAIIEAEAILNDILQKEGFLGQTLEERLNKLTTNVIENIEEVREAHKVCLNIVHDISYRLDIKESKRVLDVYEKALVDLEAL
ncbi:MAG: hypothetical protein ACKKMV_02270 [Candidatus Nealsonbacteria bacterium]|nr:MAG: hypothetical protein IB617_03290 [Candidatus Nealsonbacteria bacterium]